MQLISSHFPRRIQTQQWTPAEHAIAAAVDAVERAGAHPLLTEAVILLGNARERVADYVDLQVKLTPPAPFAGAVAAELKRARSKHPKPINSAHEGIAVLQEEFEEAQAEVFHGSDRAKLRAELIQVAAMAQRMAEDVNL